MSILHIVIYECDNPACSNRAGATELRYHGKFPKGWLWMGLCVWPNVEQGQNGGVAFCSTDCWVVYVNTEADTERLRGYVAADILTPTKGDT